MLLLTGTALLNFAAWKKLLPDPIFPDSLLSFLLSPFGGRGIVPKNFCQKYVAAIVTEPVWEMARAYDVVRRKRISCEIERYIPEVTRETTR